MASSTERLLFFKISGKRTKPLSSALGRDRQASVDAATALFEAEHIQAVTSKYVNLDTRKVARITPLPPTNPNQALAALQLMRSVKGAETVILVIFDSRCSRDGLKSPVCIPGWERALHRAVGRAIKVDKPSAPALNTVIDDIFGQVSRAINRGDSGPAAVDLLLQVPSRQFDNGDAASALSELHNFGVPNGTPCAAYYRAFRLVVSGMTGSERALAPGLGLVPEVVLLSVNEQCPQLMPSLYPGELAIRPQPFDAIDAMWLALGTLATQKTPAINATELFSYLRYQGNVFPPRRVPRLPP